VSVTFNGTTQCAFIAQVPSNTSFLVLIACRREADSGVDETWLSLDDGGETERAALQVVFDDVYAWYGGGSGPPVVTPVVDGDWVYLLYRYSGDTRVARHVVDGSTAWASNVSATGLSPRVFSALTIGAQHGPSTPADFAPMSCAVLKIWSGATLPSDAEALEERLSIAATVTTGLWALYDFRDGALGVDRSGNGRNLTLLGSPTFTSDKPADLAVGGDAFDGAAFDDVLFDTGVTIANVAPFSDGLFDTVLFDVGAVASTPLYLGADGESVIRLGTRAASALYLGPRTLF
jgi:hypothetical protein